MDSDNQTFTKDDANKALYNINMWINNCDTKASIALGFYITIITICLSSNFLEKENKILFFFFNNINFFKILYLVIHFSAILFFILGILELFNVIVPKIILTTGSNNKFNSLLFYGSIAKNIPTYEKYCEEVNKITNDKEIINDLLFQIYSAALICNKKFHKQKIGLTLTIISIIIFFITIIIGMIII